MVQWTEPHMFTWRLIIYQHQNLKKLWCLKTSWFWKVFLTLFFIDRSIDDQSVMIPKITQRDQSISKPIVTQLTSIWHPAGSRSVAIVMCVKVTQQAPMENIVCGYKLSQNKTITFEGNYWCYYSETRQLIWRSGARRFHLRMPDLQMSCRDLITWADTRVESKLCPPNGTDAFCYFLKYDHHIQGEREVTHWSGGFFYQASFELRHG